MTIPTPAGYAALQGVPLGDGQPAASRQDVLGRIGFLEDMYAQNPTFRNLSSTLVNGVSIETGQTNFNVVDPSTYHTGLGRVDFRAVRQRHVHGPLLAERSGGRERLPQSPGSARSLRPIRTSLDTNLAVSNAHIFSSSMLNEARFSLVRRDLDFPENDPVSPTATITGVFTIGGLDQLPAVARDQRVSVLRHDDVDALEAHAEVRRRHPLQRSSTTCRGFNSKGASPSTTCRRT